MTPELEALLKAYDAYQSSPAGAEASRLHAIYEARLEEAAARSSISKDLLDRAIRRKHLRWVRANLPPTFPKDLAQ